MKKRTLSREDVAFILECRSEGVRLGIIAKYVYGITPNALRLRLRVWNAA